MDQQNYPIHSWNDRNSCLELYRIILYLVVGLYCERYLLGQVKLKSLTETPGKVQFVQMLRLLMTVICKADHSSIKV